MPDRPREDRNRRKGRLPERVASPAGKHRRPAQAHREIEPGPALPNISLKRVYEPKTENDGLRLLVERLWPRGVRRSCADIDHWFKDLAPSPGLRRWYNHQPARWPEFRKRYRAELNDAAPEEIEPLLELCRDHPVTFVFAARDEARNSAVVLRQHVLQAIGGG